MATNLLVLDNLQWKRVTIAGQSGTCWKKTGGQVVIAHTDQETADTLALSNTNVTIARSKRVPLDEDTGEVLPLGFVNNNTIYYALVIEGTEQKIVVDSITNVVIVFHVVFRIGFVPFDIISGQLMSTVLSGGRFLVVNGVTTEFAVNIPSVNENGLNSGPGEYTQLIKKSRDISDGSWQKIGSPIITDTDGFQATAQFGKIRQLVATLDSTLYTFSFDAYVEPGGTLTGYKIRHGNSETGNETVLILKEVNDTYIVTVLGASGGGTVNFGFQDDNNSDWAKVTITDFQVTQSSYKLPTVPNDTTGTITVPLNHSDSDEGNKFTLLDSPLLLDALDGVADGSELNTASDAVSDSGGNEANAITGWSQIGLTGTGANVFESQSIIKSQGSYAFHADANDTPTNTARFYKDIQAAFSLVNGTRYELTFDIRHIGTGGDWIGVLGATNGAVTTLLNTVTNTDTIFESITYRFTHVTGSSRWLIFRESGATNDGGVYIDNVSVKEISPAQGELRIINGRFNFNAADASGTINLLTANDESASFIRYDIDNEQFELFDGTNESTIAHTAVNGDLWNLFATWGDNSGQKMQLFIDATPGTLVTNAGSFPTADDFSIAWLNDLWWSCEEIKTFEEPQSWPA